MLSMTDYMVAWAVYLTAGMLACVIFWRLTRPLASRDLRNVLHVVFAALVFTPVKFMADADYLAPAIIVAAFETLLQDAAAGLDAALPILVWTLLGLGVSLLDSLWRRRRQQRMQAQA